MDTILIVDDEEPVRRTFRDWLTGANLDAQILTAADAEEALKLANEQSLDLAILDWALGAGDDGLQLLQDLATFHPDIVAIMVTGYANQATPLDAMRMGVRDYLDKNQDLSRDTFLSAVRKQLNVLRPAKQMRQIHARLANFRQAVEQVLPLVQSTAALTDPVPLSDAIRGLIRLLMTASKARDAALFVRHYDAHREPAELCKAYDAHGTMIDLAPIAWAKSLAGSAFGMGQPALVRAESLVGSSLVLHPFERNREALLVLPMTVGAGVQAVVELFEASPEAWSGDSQGLIRSAAVVGEELLRQALNQKQIHERLFDAVAAALSADDMARSTEATTPTQVLAHLRDGLTQATADPRAAEANVRLAEAIRQLGQRHGPAALEHCEVLVRNVGGLLDEVTG